MSTTVSTRPSRSARPPRQEQRQRHRHLAERPASAARHVSLVDQAALRLGLLLITWGRRANHVSRAQLTLRHQHHMARQQRELRAERMLLLNVPRL
jgi:hypothetical protein